MTTAIHPSTTPTTPPTPASTAGHRAEAAPPPAIVVRGLCVHYRTRHGAVTAVDHLDLDVPRGQHLAVLGLSGSGKTTLVGCLSGRITPTAGQLRCDGQTAVIHQDLRLVKQKSALENVLHGSLGRQPWYRGIVRFPRHEVDAARRWLTRVGLARRMHMPVARLSGGEQQRVAIARALMQQPTTLLADEPVASLDNVNARAVMNLLDQIAREHRLTVISVLHDCDLAESFADRIISMEHGRLIHDQLVGAADGSPDASCNGCRVLKQHLTTKQLARLEAGDSAQRDGEAGDASSEADGTGRPEPSDLLIGRLTPWRLAIFATLAFAVYAWSFASLDLGSQSFADAGRGMWRFIERFFTDMPIELPHLPYGELAWSLVETMQMALIGTTIAIALSWPMAALAARNVVPGWVLQPMRGLLNAVRTVPSIIWALLFVAAVGVGAFAGILALIAYTIGYLTKFYYEGFEAVDPGPPSALKEIGAGGLQRFLHAIWPGSKPIILSSSIFMLEYNVRAASVLGVVGAGGIGWYMKTYIEARNFPAAFVCLAMLLIVVFALDALSTRVRARLVD